MKLNRRAVRACAFTLSGQAAGIFKLGSKATLIYNPDEARIKESDQRCLMPFKALLKELVESVQGASGAMLLESDGEAVQWYTEMEVERLRLRGAYIALVLQGGSRAITRAELGDTGCTILQYDGASFLGQQVERDYFLVLELDSSANMGQAIHRIQPTVASIRRALVA